ncbi:hypothetical protein ElyMa_004394800 [Elysia marginata]|uniref:EGF-like domain-containing protein n=1 Tax=Elysia marginata TaxID=1093978 RepID=A0AAV4H9L8_9GAST|nr:hypothetical protein ElyMa_004394800 [Elysia marginata]
MAVTRKFVANWRKSDLIFNLEILLGLLLVSCAHSGAIRGTVPTCHPRDRDPCANFPELCSAGNGLCVVKKPCEYECVCPPDGRVGRDCSNGNSQPSDGTSQGAPGGTGTSSNDKQVDSLLVFPPDLFWDLNHVAQQEDLIKTIPVPEVTAPQTTASPPSMARMEESAIFTISATKAEASTSPPSTTRTGTTLDATSFPEKPTAIITTRPASLPTTTVAGLQTSLNVADAANTMISLSPTTPKESYNAKSSTPTPPDRTSGNTATSFGPQSLILQTEAVTSTQQPVTPKKAQTTPVSSSRKLSTPPSRPRDQRRRADIIPEKSQELFLFPESTVRWMDSQHDSPVFPSVHGTPNAGDIVRSTRITDAVSPLGSKVRSLNSDLVPPHSSSNSPLPELQNSHSGIQHATHAAETLKSTASPTEVTTVTEPFSLNQPFPKRSGFPTFFSRGALDTAQDTSDHRALHRTAQRVFHPLEAFHMLPKP